MGVGVFLLLGVCAVILLFWKPREVLLGGLKRVHPEMPFQLEKVDWKSADKVVLHDVQFGDFFKARTATLRWKYRQFLQGHISELKVESPEIMLDLSKLNALGKGAMGRLPLHLDRLIVERGRLTVLGLGKNIPPITLDIEGDFPDVPLGAESTREYLDKARQVTLRNLVLYSPLDLAVPLVSIPQLDLNFTMAGIQIHRLDQLAFRGPTLGVDRGLFWFVDALRKNSSSRQANAASGPDWTVGVFEIFDGKLDITRLREMDLRFPFPFEFRQENMNLNQLNLAQAQFQLTIPNQDVPWETQEVFFRNLHGKIAFHMSSSTTNGGDSAGMTEPLANDLVNTIYVDAIRWKEMEVKSCWLALTFDTKSITGSYGGAFADGYVNGGTTCGWSGKDAWRVWGAAANIDTGRISSTFHNESYAMDGRAAMAFDSGGRGQDLQGTLTLDSKSSGSIRIDAIDRILERIERNTVGLKRESLRVLVENLRNYPYDAYSMRVDYQRPEATLKFRANGRLGKREIDVRWHGLNPDKLVFQQPAIETFENPMHNMVQAQ